MKKKELEFFGEKLIDEINVFREELIKEIKGIISIKGSLDISRNTKVLRCYRGMNEPFVSAMLWCDKIDGMLPITSGWLRSAVYRLTLWNNGDVVVCCDTAFTSTDGLCVADLRNIRDFIRNMSEEEITLCNRYDFSDEEDFYEEVK